MEKSHKGQEDAELRICSECGMKLEDNQPRGFWVYEGAMGVMCISCTEGETQAIVIGTPKDPISFEGEDEK